MKKILAKIDLTKCSIMCTINKYIRGHSKIMWTVVVGRGY